MLADFYIPRDEWETMLYAFPLFCPTMIKVAEAIARDKTAPGTEIIIR